MPSNPSAPERVRYRPPRLGRVVVSTQRRHLGTLYGNPDTDPGTNICTLHKHNHDDVDCQY